MKEPGNIRDGEDCKTSYKDFREHAIISNDKTKETIMG